MNPTQSVSRKASMAEDLPLFLPDWEKLLDGILMGADSRSRWRYSLRKFLEFCGQVRRPATIALMKAYLDRERKRGEFVAETRLALLWFVKEAKKNSACNGLMVPGSLERSSVPSIGTNDLGTEEWEVALIRALRRRGLMWRTEETYRGWARRFAVYIAPMPVVQATGNEVRGFLEELAVKLRVSASTQKQALNAIVFLMQEGLRVHLGDFSDFRRAEASRRVPTVLTPAEMRAVFGELSATTRLMAELAYGSGLRLIELLRLRIGDIDLERMQVTVRSGKGAKIGRRSCLLGWSIDWLHTKSD